MAVTKAQKNYNTLIKTKQREVALRVRASELPVTDFDFIDMEEREAVLTSLLYKPDHHFHFDFIPSTVEWAVRYSPAEHTVSSGWQGVGTWESVLVRVDWWLSYLKRELETPDPWEALTEAVPFESAEGIDNDQFTQTELAQVLERIDHLRTYLLDSEVRAEQDRHIIIERLDYLSDAAKRSPKFDWRNIAAGIVIDLGMRGLLDTGMARQVFDYLIGATQLLLR